MQLTRVRRLIVPLLLLLAMPGLAGTVSAQAMVSPAASVASRLGSIETPIVSVYDYSAVSDPEGLLGLQGQYTSKAYFRDNSSVEGFVEVFSTANDARIRKAALDQVGGTDPFSGDYVVVAGPVVLRLFGATESAATGYTQRLGRLLRTP
jgi:hypothetical protein